MRTLTIKRTKSFVACLAKTKIYIEDAVNPELTIADVPCRKLGELKSGEEQRFEIDEGAHRVFAIVDKLSKEYCNDHYPIPAGEEDVTLSGKHIWKSSQGNPFRFDNLTDPVALAYRLRSKKKALKVHWIALLIGLVIGIVAGIGIVSMEKSEPQLFQKNGMNITLTNDFYEFTDEYTGEGFTACYASGDVAIFAIEERFDAYEGLDEYTLDEYGMDIIIGNGFGDSVQLKKNGALCWFEYESTDAETNENYHYSAYLYKERDAFWMVQFGALAEEYEKYRSEIEAWANSIMFY